MFFINSVLSRNMYSPKDRSPVPEAWFISYQKFCAHLFRFKSIFRREEEAFYKIHFKVWEAAHREKVKKGKKV
jgi:hypothetical protein